jgi:hypothetical protein
MRRAHRLRTARAVHHSPSRRFPPAVPIATAPVAGAAPATAAPPRKRSPADQGTSARPKRDDTLPATVTRTVRDIVEVVPPWARALMLALAALFALAMLFVAAAARRTRRLDRQRTALQEQVGVLQAALLPDVPPALGALEVSVAYRPAAGLAAGGDFYDAFPLEGGRVGLLVGDVSGHGRASLAPATFIRHMVRSYLEAGLPPRVALQVAGKVVDEHRSDEFATVIAAVHDPSAGTLSYAAAGHPPPIVTGPGAYRPLTAASSPPLGVGSATGLRQTTLPLSRGMTVCFFTDGLVEARRGGSVYGTPRLERAVGELGQDASAQELLDRVAAETDQFADDVAACLVRATASSTVAATAVEEIEVTSAELRDDRLRRFLTACELDARDIARAVEAVTPRVAAGRSCVIRVSIAGGAARVDVMSPRRFAEMPVARPASVTAG